MGRHGLAGAGRSRKHVEHFRNLFPDAGGRRTLIPQYMCAPKQPHFLSKGNCRDFDPGLFEYAPRLGIERDERLEGEQRVAKAKLICGGVRGYRPECPVREQCLKWALEAGQTGVHGGVHIRPETLLRYRAEKKEEQDAAEAQAPEDHGEQLAERPPSVLRHPDRTAGGALPGHLRQASA